MAATLRKTGALDDLKARYGEQLWVAPLDLTDLHAAREVVDRAFRELRRVDVVVNNAAYALFGAGEEASDEQIRAQISTNLLGSMGVVRAALPHLRSQGGGRVLQISSEGGQIAYPNFSFYHATKWGIEGWVEAVAQEVAPFGIEFTLVEPGPTKTNFVSGLASAPSMPEYDPTPAGDVRRAVTSGAFEITGDPEKMVDAMLACVEVSPAPKRLTLGKGAYASIARLWSSVSPRSMPRKKSRVQPTSTLDLCSPSKTRSAPQRTALGTHAIFGRHEAGSLQKWSSIKPTARRLGSARCWLFHAGGAKLDRYNSAFTRSLAASKSVTSPLSCKKYTRLQIWPNNGPGRRPISIK